ncbi:MAG: hypothetical protein QXM93_05700 [Candidatus Methanomethyliaceae archaeon]
MLEKPCSTRVDGDVRRGTCEHFCEIAWKAWNLRHQEEHLRQTLPLEYGDVGSFISANSIERKPFFHFWSRL